MPLRLSLAPDLADILMYDILDTIPHKLSEAHYFLKEYVEDLLLIIYSNNPS